MKEWIIANKEWVFSGIGLAIIGGIWSILTILGTLYLKNKSEQKNLKKLNIDYNYKNLSLPKTHGRDDFSKHLNVSYKNKEYRFLSYRTFVIENIGNPAIENQIILLTFPPNTQFIEKDTICSNNMIVANEFQSITRNNEIEMTITINRMEPGDKVDLSYLINSDSIENIKINPRGVENAKYYYNNISQKGMSDTEKIIIAVVVILIADSMPFLGGVFKGLTLLSVSGIIKKVVVDFFERLYMNKNKISVESGRDVIIEVHNN